VENEGSFNGGKARNIKFRLNLSGKHALNIKI